jgi:hypothetical protein
MIVLVPAQTTVVVSDNKKNDKKGQMIATVFNPISILVDEFQATTVINPRVMNVQAPCPHANLDRRRQQCHSLECRYNPLGARPNNKHSPDQFRTRAETKMSQFQFSRHDEQRQQQQQCSATNHIFPHM